MGYLLIATSQLLAQNQCILAIFVPKYRCETVPDSNRVLFSTLSVKRAYLGRFEDSIYYLAERYKSVGF